MAATLVELPTLLRVLSDTTRLRILGLLELEELSVGELGRALGMAQSRVSNHLRVLREAELLSERHVGTSTILRPAPRLIVPPRPWKNCISTPRSFPTREISPCAR